MPLRPHVRRAARLLLAMAALAAVAAAGTAAPAVAAAFTDAAGRQVMLPERINRVLAAEHNAEILVYVLAPGKLAGLQRPPAARGNSPDVTVQPPGLRFRPDTTLSGVVAAARNAGADLILDAGSVTPERAAFADQVQQQTGIPYVLVDDSFDRMPSVLRTIGTVLGVPEQANVLRLFAENAIGGTRGGLLIRSAETRPRVYYGLGPDGLTTPLPGVPAAQTLAEAGAINVAAPLGRNAYTRISREQLLAWDPDIIIAQYPGFYDTLRRDRSWGQLAAVRSRKVYLEPAYPFGWIGDPPGVNRLIGLNWLSALFYPEPTHDELRGMVCEFYDRFYRVRLTNRRLNDMLALAGIPRPQRPQSIGGLPGDLGTVPSAAAAPPAAVPVIPGTGIGIPGVPDPTSSMAFPDQPDALCTIPGVANPVAELAGSAPLPVIPGGRMRQPSLGSPPSPGP